MVLAHAEGMRLLQAHPAKSYVHVTVRSHPYGNYAFLFCDTVSPDPNDTKWVTEGHGRGI